MTCPRCGGRIVRDNDLLESSRKICLNCGHDPNMPLRAPPREDHGRNGLVRRARMSGETRRRVAW